MTRYWRKEQAVNNEPGGKEGGPWVLVSACKVLKHRTVCALDRQVSTSRWEAVVSLDLAQL